ncbi:allergin-1 isoform X2 [Ambystoma mexicanum]|uniref:allergin-1 isoform X2 n=1 Tax=Ambystoma mexicanum TaxID=8296 RepID=UPI0037E94080
MLFMLWLPLLLATCDPQGLAMNEPVSQPDLWPDAALKERGQNVTLLCFSREGSPPITYKLFRADVHLRHVQVEERNRSAEFTFTLNNVSDTGEYKCTAENNFTAPKKYSAGLNITLFEPLSNPVLFSNTNVTAIGQNVTLSCTSRGGFRPSSYMFYKSKSYLGTVHVGEENKTAEYTVSIKYASDDGEYKCVTENNFTASKKYSYGLRFIIVEPVAKPKLYSSSLTAAVGQNVTLSCLSSSGSLPIKYSLFRGDMFLVSVTRDDRLPATRTVLLNSSHDLGTYRCKAENKLPGHERYSESFNMTMEVKNSYSTGLITGLVVILILLAIFLAIPLLILPKCKARKHNSLAAANAPSEEKEIVFAASQEPRENAVTKQDDSAVEYADVCIKKLNKVTEREDSAVEYSLIHIKEHQEGEEC